MTVKLYYGDNGAQEFWEAEHQPILLFRNHAEAWWFVVLDGRVIPPGRALDEAIEYAERYSNRPLILDPAKVWKKDGNGEHMKLTPV